MSRAPAISRNELQELAKIGIVSRETVARFEVFVDELARWQQVKNLVSQATLNEVWHRHVIDSAQLFGLQPLSRQWLDLGSGGGLPGVILGILLSDVGGHIHLVEANSRKCAFLRHAVRATGASATVHQKRVEECISEFVGRSEVVTARALAPLPQLLEWSKNVLEKGAVGLFPKGQDVVSELTEASRSWTMEYELIASRTDAAARIVRVRSIGEARR